MRLRCVVVASFAILALPACAKDGDDAGADDWGDGDDEDSADSADDQGDDGDDDGDGDGDGDAGDGDGGSDDGGEAGGDPDMYPDGGWPIDDCADDIEPTGIQLGGVVPNFSLMSQTGEMVELHDFCGRAVVLELGAFWCGTCQVWAAHLGEIDAMFPDDVVQVASVTNSNRDGDPATLEDLQAWADQYGITGPVMADPFYQQTGGYTSLGSGLPHIVILLPGMVLHSVDDYAVEDVLGILADEGITPP